MTKKSKVASSVLAWHGTKSDGTTKYLKVKEVVGIKSYITGEIEICENALHGSIRAVDMLHFSGGLWVKRTLHEGIVIKHCDKIGSSERTIIAEADATQVIVDWALWCAHRAFSTYLAADSEHKDSVAVYATKTAAHAADTSSNANRGNVTNASRCATWTAHAAAHAASAAGGDAHTEITIINKELEQRLFSLMGLK